MNADQITSLATTLMVIVGSVFSVLVATGKLTTEQSSTLTNALSASLPALITLGVTVWKLVGHSDAAKVEGMKTVPGVHVAVDTTAASEAVKAVAEDPKVPNVNPI